MIEGFFGGVVDNIFFECVGRLGRWYPSRRIILDHLGLGRRMGRVRLDRLDCIIRGRYCGSSETTVVASSRSLLRSTRSSWKDGCVSLTINSQAGLMIFCAGHAETVL